MESSPENSRPLHTSGRRERVAPSGLDKPQVGGAKEISLLTTSLPPSSLLDDLSDRDVLAMFS
jgi:hypothetical protein